MKILSQLLIFLVICIGCTRHPSLPLDSKYNVTSSLNDSTWYGTGRILRFGKSVQTAQKARTFNLLVYTDIGYQGMENGPNANTKNGCLDECIRTQALVIYNVPLKKGKHSIKKIDASRKLQNEYASLSYISNAGGLMKFYIHENGKPGWIRINRVDKTAGTIDGSFHILLHRDKRYPDDLKMLPETAEFKNGLFRIKVTDIVER